MQTNKLLKAMSADLAAQLNTKLLQIRTRKQANKQHTQ
jgi:hypothetical protein